MKEDARSRKEAKVVQINPKIAFLGIDETRFQPFYRICKQMKWEHVYLQNSHELIDYNIKHTVHAIVGADFSVSDLKNIYCELRPLGKYSNLCFVCVDASREVYDYFKGIDIGASYLTSETFTLANVMKQIRQHKPNLIRIAVADDLFVIRSQLKMAILIMKYSLVGEAPDGIEATEICVNLKPDILTLDINMPMKNGLQALSDIKKYSPYTRIVMVSGQGTANNVIESARMGIKHFISKPFTREMLMNTIHTAAMDTSHLV